MKRTIIVDIDGTISEVGDRLKYLKQSNPDWDKFYDSSFEDKPIDDILQIVETLMIAGYDIYFCTGRRDSVRFITIDWLKKHLGSLRFYPSDWYDTHLLMRPDGDHRHDVDVKPELLLKAGIPFESILFILEDRDSMVKKWRDIGITCLQVNEGDF